jgi:hypothetical protein
VLLQFTEQLNRDEGTRTRACDAKRYDELQKGIRRPLDLAADPPRLFLSRQEGSDQACLDWLLDELDVRLLDAVPLQLFKDLGLALLMEGGETIWRSFSKIKRLPGRLSSSK